jgi:hypothetical protein
MSRLFRCTVAAVVVGMSLTACGGDSKPKAETAATTAASQPGASAAAETTAVDPVAAGAALLKVAGEKADEAGTVSYTMVMKTTVPGQGEVTTNAEGVSSMKPPLRGRISMTMDMAGKPIAMEMVMTPDAMYIKYPPDMAKAFGGKAWVKMAFADLEKVAGLDFKQLVEQSQQNSPTAYLKALVAAGDIKEVGKEEIRGIETTHYSGTITPDALTKAYKGDVQVQMEALLKQMGTSPIKMDVWLAGDGLPRRLHQVMTVAGNDADIVIDLLEYGAKLDVTPPPADETTDIGNMLGGTPPS